MPYIKNDGRREALRKGEPALNAGELNYQIFYTCKHHRSLYSPMHDIYGESKLCQAIEIFISQFLGENPNYQRWNDMTGALIRCQKELKRRLNIEAEFLSDIMESYDGIIAAYEDFKILENGDVE